MYRLWFLLVAWSVSPAQTPPPAPGQDPPRIGVSVSQTRLSLEEAIQMALRNNLEIEIEKTAQAAAAESVRGAQAYLDPSFRWLPSVERRVTPTGNVLASPTGKLQENFLAQNISFRQRTPWQGATFQADFENLRQSTNNPFLNLNPYITPRLAVGFTAPLLRGRQIDRERADVVIRRKQLDSADATFELRVIDVVARVEQAYYDLVAVRADLDVIREGVTLAREQLDRTRRFIASGTVAPVELAAAEAELERREDDFFSAINLLNQAENNLKTLLASGRDDAIWKDVIIPTTSERAQPLPDLPNDLAELVKNALGQRVELRLLNVRRDVNHTERQLAREQSRVQLNLTGAYISNGLAGSLLSTGNPFAAQQEQLVNQLNLIGSRVGVPPITGGGFGNAQLPADFVGGYGQSLYNLFSLRYSTLQAGVTLDWNWRNTAANSTIAQTAITERRIGLERRQIEQAIEAQLRNALQGIESSRQRILAAETSARAAREKLDSEVRLYQTGESTNFLVLTRQNELSDSRRRVVLATLEYNKSIKRLAFALGRTVEQYGLRIR